MKTSRKIAFSSLLAAITVILMLIGSLFGSLDLASAALASLCIILAVIEMGYKNAALIYAASAAIALLLLPSKAPAMYFTLFFGYYPIVKSLAERLKRPLAYTVKVISFSVSYTALALLANAFLSEESPARKYLIAGYFVGAVIFIIFDFGLSRVISSYLFSLRKRLGADRFFGNNKQ